MERADQIFALEAENRRLRQDNDRLLRLIAQMKVTMNRLIDRYIMEKN